MVYLTRTTWAGLQGGPGITVLAFNPIVPETFLSSESVQVVVNALRAFWNTINDEIPNDVVLTVQPTVDGYNTATGELTASWTAATPPSTVVGASASNYSAASGAKIRLFTDGVKNNRRVRGAIFLVPLGAGAYDSNGGVVGSIGTDVAAAWATLDAALEAEGLEMGVWSRPIGTPPGTGGSFHPITGVSVPPKVAVLRGRRDA